MAFWQIGRTACATACLSDWKSHWPLWSGEHSPITLGWKSGALRVTAGGQTFTGTLRDGKYAFGNGTGR